MKYRDKVQITGKPGSGQTMLKQQLETWSETHDLNVDITVINTYPDKPFAVDKLDDGQRLVIVKDQTAASKQHAYRLATQIVSEVTQDPYIHTTGWPFNDQTAYEILETNPTFTPTASYATWGNKATGTKEFVTTHRRMPKRTSKDDTEAMLGAWINEQRKQYKRDKLDEAQVLYLEEIPQWGWSYADEIKAKTLIKMLQNQEKLTQLPNPLMLDRTKSILIEGEVGAGKTTVLAAALETLPTTENILVYEDFPQMKTLLPDHKILSMKHWALTNYDNLEYIALDGLNNYDDIEKIRQIQQQCNTPIIATLNTDYPNTKAELQTCFDYLITVTPRTIIGKPII